MIFDRPSKAAIVLCKRDLEQAKDLIRMWRFAGNRSTDLMVLSTDDTIVTGVEFMGIPGVPEGHPAAVNAAFRRLIELSSGSFNFLFLEPDVAIHPERGQDILEKCEAQLRFRGGRILGAPIHVPGHGWTHNGVAFYAHDIGDHISWEGHDVQKEPFDDWLRDQIYPWMLAPTNLIQHAPGPQGIKGATTLDPFGPAAAIYHGVKDRSLGRLCLASSADKVQE